MRVMSSQLDAEARKRKRQQEYDKLRKGQAELPPTMADWMQDFCQLPLAEQAEFERQAETLLKADKDGEPDQRMVLATAACLWAGLPLPAKPVRQGFMGPVASVSGQ